MQPIRRQVETEAPEGHSGKISERSTKMADPSPRELDEFLAKVEHGLTKEMRGIEVAPFFAPLAPKREG